MASPNTLAGSFELSGGFILNLSFCYLAQELLSPDGGEGEAPEEEERRAGSDCQAPGGESPETPGGKPQSRECGGLPLLGSRARRAPYRRDFLLATSIELEAFSFPLPLACSRRALHIISRARITKPRHRQLLLLVCGVLALSNSSLLGFSL